MPDGSVEYKGVLINLESKGADGIKVDTDGNIYIAVGGQIAIYTSKGKYLTSIVMPNNSATNLCFGRGKWSKTLFITSRKKLYRIDTKKEGFHIPFKK